MSNPEKPKNNHAATVLVFLVGAPLLILFSAWTLMVLLGWVGLHVTIWEAFAVSMVCRFSTINPWTATEKNEDGAEGLVIRYGADAVFHLIVLGVDYALLWAMGWPQLSGVFG